ncbi:MAG: heparinase II/III domain-containing protein, partial [Gemmatimonadaceae bacterium]
MPHDPLVGPPAGGIWLAPDTLAARRAAAHGPLAPLATSLAADLAPFLDAELPLPPEKARLSRAGGRCPRDGAFLRFDPRSPRLHACPRCGNAYDDDAHYRSWIVGFHLWLAERAVHAAALHALLGDEAHRRFAVDVLARYADAYLRYPNADNVLGPTRPFFSTYLESLWLLHVCTALDLLETVSGPTALGATVRERVVAPSVELVASYDEGSSNRQLWNDAAMIAARLVLGEREATAPIIWGPSGIAAQLSSPLLADGTWYEGENYHQFAHRGLWYGVHLTDAAGQGQLPAEQLRRFDAGFAAPFLTALPDFTAPARRDSHHAVSLRQWRFAEMAELGLARRPHDAALRAALSRLYDGDAAAGDSGRWRSTGESERNEPAVALGRASLGWRSLLFALPELPPLAGAAPRSVLLDGQGLAILRRDAGNIYVALDYGHGGGGHGHPDRLDLLYADGDTRWLDDPGTGSYVDPSLHWYRGTLAHCAPLVDGRSQRPASGELCNWDERGGVGWVDALVEGAAPDVTLRRTVVVLPGYFVDLLSWRAGRDVRVELPLHSGLRLDDVAEWEPHTLDLDGASYLREVERPVGMPGGHGGGGAAAWTLTSLASGSPVAWLTADGPVAWWRAIAPGPP